MATRTNTKYWVAKNPEKSTSKSGSAIAADFFDDDVIYDIDEDSDTFGEPLTKPNYEKVEQLIYLSEPLTEDVMTGREETGSFKDAQENGSSAFNKWRDFIRSPKIPAGAVLTAIGVGGSAEAKEAANAVDAVLQALGLEDSV